VSIYWLDIISSAWADGSSHREALSLKGVRIVVSKIGYLKILASQELHCAAFSGSLPQFNGYIKKRPLHFRLGNAMNNMSHRYEKPGIGGLDDIRKDMRNFLNSDNN